MKSKWGSENKEDVALQRKPLKQNHKRQKARIQVESRTDIDGLPKSEF